jgi:natural product biosynthesis luciferase-like monooxygenase protein
MGDRRPPPREPGPLSDEQRRLVIEEWNATDRPIPDQCIAQLFEEQARRTADAPALVFGEQEMSYRELETRANRLAHYLRRHGVDRGVLVGLCLERSPEVVVAMLGILKAGGAYVPLDPGYPRERIAFMLEDAAPPVLVTLAGLREALDLRAPQIVLLDRDAPAIAGEPSAPPAARAEPQDLAYALYTSGSTGKPKGVMVRQRNVVNFFVGMDECLGTDPGVWLAVTSLSFDISVLELLWTLCRGYKVVLYADGASKAATSPSASIDFSLMFFASAEGAADDAQDKYHLLIDAARFGDRHGFTAVWTPERHFFAFGGLYPNPSVASAALATITERIQLRAGSVVSPLHNPIRIAEEWALVDNLSRGRVGISFASGWQPVDFVLRPDAFADRKAILFRDVETVRRLWRGESLTCLSPLGKEEKIRTLPRPVQKELPVWVTAAGNPETFVEAARIGANVLTHLLGQKVEEVGEKIALYRKTWAAAGHPGRGVVTLMLHTFVGPDADDVREMVRQPMKDYLRSSVSLIKAAAWTFPTLKQKADAAGRSLAELIDAGGLSEEDMDALLEHAFERYHGSSGLFGTPASCLKMIERLKDIGVDEVACLLDFGVPTAKVLEHLPYLLELKERAAAWKKEPKERASLSPGALLRTHNVSHLQCTPSRARMMALEPETRSALGALRVLLLGGEVLPADLLAKLGDVPGRQIYNMYGPTETTVWSTAARVDRVRGSIPIGRPLANTRVYVVDDQLRPVGSGAPGELCIGGEGVTAGYLHRPELTAERFPPDPFSKRPGARMYRTGDQVRFRPDGMLEFLGRLDHQVKIRGHRIEPGEIESVLRLHPSVRDAAVAAFQEDGGEKRLAAYLVAANGELPAVGDLRRFVADRLPAYMIPAAFVHLEALPLTANGKIDRKALPVPGPNRPQLETPFLQPRTPIEERLARLWREVLGTEQVGVEDSFLQLGGDSLSAIKLVLEVRNAFGVEVPLHKLFESPTIAGLARIIKEAPHRAQEDS